MCLFTVAFQNELEYFFGVGALGLPVFCVRTPWHPKVAPQRDARVRLRLFCGTEVTL